MRSLKGRSYSETSAAEVDAKIKQLLQERYDFARGCLTEKREALDALVQALMEHETVTQAEMEKLIGARMEQGQLAFA